MIMDKNQLIIKSLQIDKMPGFPNGLPPFTELSEYINIVSGPNASGKTSTARMIKTALWPENDNSGLYLDCKMQVDSELWNVKIESNKTFSTRNGNPDRFSELPPKSSQSRYFLSLHELIKSEDKQLAEHIIKESSGGYDLSQAAKKLSYNDSFYRSTITERKAYDDVKAKYLELLQKQAQLKHEEDNLSVLKNKCDKAKKAKDFVGLYTLKSEHLKYLSQYEIAKAKFNQFPRNLAKLNDSDYEQLQVIESEKETIQKSLQKANTLIESENQKLHELIIPENGISDALIEEWEIRIEHIKDLNRKIELAESKLQNAKIAADEALKQLAPQTNPEKWQGLNFNQIKDIEQFIVEASQLSIKANSLKHEIASLSEEIESSVLLDVQKIQLGIAVLSDWLKAQSAGESTKPNKVRWLGITGIITAIITFLVSFLWGILGFFPLIFGIVVLIIIASRPSKITPLNSDNFISDFERTGLEAPSSWTSEVIVERLKSLENQLKEGLSKQQKENELARQKSDYKKLQPELNNLIKIRSELKEKYGAFPEIPDGETINFASPGWFFVNAKKWQEAHQQILEISAQQGNLNAQLAKEKSIIQSNFSEYNFNASNDESSFMAILKTIKLQENIRKEAHHIIRENQARIDADKKQLQTLINKQDSIYTRLELEPGQIELVRNLDENLPDYQLAKKTLSDTKLLLKEKEERLSSHSLYSEIDNDIAYDQIDVKIQNYQEQANQYDELVNHIASIREKIKQVGDRQELQNTLAEQDAAIDQLQVKYEENLSAITGHLLVETLREETRETQYPEVFKLAESYFVNITGGKYKLDISNFDNTIVFRAFDITNQNYLQLDQLSSGTRIQLLLSVRLAFIEQQEKFVSLPLIIDELLANSDDIRARAIIDALIKISENGRQIFYFTAQDDELAKWKAHLKENKLTTNYIRLGKEAEKADITESFSLPKFENPDLPKPDDMSHAEYGKAIDVQSFNPLIEHADQLHLWYVIDSPDLLYNCLNKNIRELGALRTYLQYGGQIANAPKQFKSYIDDYYKVLKQFINLYRKGRAIPIDRHVLEQANAVSDTYVDRVNEVLKSVNNDPARLIEALENGAVSGFRTKKVEELEQYLKDQNFLSDEQPLSDEDIKIRLQAFISELTINENTFTRLLISV